MNIIVSYPSQCITTHHNASQVLLAYLMKLRNASADDMLHVVQGKRACADPNPGFMLQLDAWQHMGFTCDRQHAAYGQTVRMMEV